MTLPAYTLDMTQAATYWPPPVPDGTGGVVFSAQPTVIACRWQDQHIMFHNAQGEEVMSSAVVYVDRELEIGGYLFLGDATEEADYIDAQEVGAKEIRQRAASPSLEGDMQLNKVWL